MQQRRGTAEQWTAANPILAAGEIGFETDTSKFKMGNGSSAWSALTYFANAAELAAIVDGAPGLLNTLNELAQAIGDDPAFITTVAGNLSNHEADTSNVHGIANTALLVTTTALETSLTTAIDGHNVTTNVHGIADTEELATKEYADDAIAAEAVITSDNLSQHNTDTSDVHGIADTTALVTLTQLTDAITDSTVDQQSLAGTGIDWNSEDERFDIDSTIATKVYADNAVSTHDSDTSNVHGIADTAALATKTYADGAVSTAVGALTKSSVGLANVDNTSDANKPVSTATQTALDLKAPKADPTFTGTVSGVTKTHVGLGNVDNTSDANKPVSTATQTALDAKASLAGATFTGNVEVDGNMVVDGDFTVNGTNFSASATSITIEDNMLQLAHQNVANTVDLGLVVGYNDGAAKHAGLVRDVSDAKWKLFKGVTSEPSTTVDFTQGSLDDLKVAAFEATTVTPSSGVVFTDGTQTKEGTPSRTPIVPKTGAYTLSELTHRDSLIEVSHTGGTAVKITVPADATLNYPIGTSIDILQTNTGEVSVEGASTVTVNATPGLTLRTRWSSATLFKRAANTWVLFGDLK